jgi:hypothetical protein
MPSNTARHLPVAGVDPIVDPSSAWSVFSYARRLPRRAEVLVLVLDRARRGRALLQVAGTRRPVDVVHVVEFVAEAAGPHGHALVVASMRPGMPVVGEDASRWRRLDATCDRAGLVLVEWFVDGGRRHGPRIDLPRELVGDPPRWQPGRGAR